MTLLAGAVFLCRDVARALVRCLQVRVLFTFENRLPSRQADAEVFTTTAGRLARRLEHAALHVPQSRRTPWRAPSGLAVVPALAPARPGVLRHAICGITIVGRRAFRDADLIYTRNLWVATTALLFGQRVVFDHYRPWPAQIPPLRPVLRVLIGHRRFVLNICHSDYTRDAYRRIGVPAAKLVTIRNGFAPERLGNAGSVVAAKTMIGVPISRATVVYTGRVNHKKGLDLLVEAAARLPDVLFLLVGGTGDEPPGLVAGAPPNVRIVPWQAEAGLARYLAAADVLVIPPSTRPLGEFGSTVLPLKVFLYMAAGRPILAGATPDVEEVLRHGENAFLCPPDDAAALACGLATLLADEALRSRLAAASLSESGDLTWDARADRILAAITARERSVDHARDRSVDHARDRSVDSVCDPTTPAERRAWLGQCARWLLHAIRHRSVVLPPAGHRRHAGDGFRASSPG